MPDKIKSPDFQETLKRMLGTPPKENKPLNQSERKSDKKGNNGDGRRPN